MKLLAIVALLPSLLLAQARPLAEIKVKIEAPETDKLLLLNKLNEHGADHHMHFTSVQDGFDYRLVFGTQQPSAPWGGNTSAAGVSAFDTEGKEIFRFSRSNRATDKGAANAVAKEIIKRLLEWRSLLHE
jgi:hypothetical protein